MGVATSRSPFATLAGTWHQTHPHQALQSQNKRKGRALHPDRTSGMGLCQSLSNIRSARPRAADLAAPIQLAPTPRWYKISNADQQARFDQGQPLEAPQLGQEEPALADDQSTAIMTSEALIT